MSNKFDHYIDNPNRPPQTVEESTLQELLAMKENFVPNENFVADLEHQLVNKHHQSRRNSMPRFAIGVATLLMIVFAVLLIPDARSFAQDSFNKLFQKSDVDVLEQEDLQVTSAVQQIWHEYTSIEEAEEELQINIHAPARPPAAYSLTSVNISKDLQSASLYYETPGRVLLISYKTITADTAERLVGNSANIIEVEINGVTGEYVEGDWVNYDPEEDTDFEWLNNAASRKMRWIKDGILYEIMSMGGSPDSRAYIGMEEMIELGESLD